MKANDLNMSEFFKITLLLKLEIWFLKKPQPHFGIFMRQKQMTHQAPQLDNYHKKFNDFTPFIITNINLILHGRGIPIFKIRSISYTYRLKTVEISGE